MADAQEQKRFIANQGKKPRRPKKPKQSLARGKGVNRTSDKQRERTAFLHGIKADRLWQQMQAVGAPYCERCHREVDVIELHAAVTESDVIEAAMTTIDLHHPEKRSQGIGYRGQSDHGVDSPALLELLCRKCHREAESNPEFGRAS